MAELVSKNQEPYISKSKDVDFSSPLDGLKTLKPEEKAKILGDKQKEQNDILNTTQNAVGSVNNEIAKKTDSVVTITLNGQGETLSRENIQKLTGDEKFIALVANLDGDKAGIEASNKEGLGTKFIRVFNSDYGIDSTSGSQKFVVGESQLYTLLKNAHAQNSEFLPDLQERFGITQLDASGAEKLRNGILEATKQLQMVQDLVTNSHDTSVDIVTVLRDSDHKYIEALLTDPIAIKKIAENERTNPDGFKKKLAAVIKALPDIGHTVALNNFYVRANTHELTSDGKSGAIADRSFGWKQYTMSVGGDLTGGRVGLNWNDAEHKMNEEINAMRKKIDETKDIPSLQSVVDTLVADDSSKKVIRDVISQLSQKNIPFVEIQNACANLVSQNKMIEFASTEKWNVKGVEGLVKWSGFGAILKGQSPLTVYAGIVLDKYGVEVKNGNRGLAEKIASEINNVSIDFSAAKDKDGYVELPGGVVRAKVLPDNKYEYRFISGDIARTTGVTDKLNFTTQANGEQVVVTDAPLKISFKARVAPNGTQTLTFSIKEGEKIVTPSATASSETTEEITVSDVKQDTGDIASDGKTQELRSSEKKNFRAFAESWWKGDITAIKLSLITLAKKNPALGKAVKEAGDDSKKLLALSDALMAINMGDRRMRNAGGKLSGNFQDIYASTFKGKHGEAEQRAFEENEKNLFGDVLDSVSGTKLDQKILDDRRAWKKDLSALKFSGSEKPVEAIPPDIGYFTVISMAQTKDTTGIHSLVAIPMEKIIRGTAKETTALSPKNKAALLGLVFNRESFADRRDAILETLKKATGKDVSREDAIALLSGAKEEIDGVKLAEPLKFTRAQFSVCANDSFLIGKPEFIKHNRTVTSVPTPTIAAVDGYVVADAGIQGGREVNMAGGIGIQQEIPTIPTTPENQQQTGEHGTTAENGTVTDGPANGTVTNSNTIGGNTSSQELVAASDQAVKQAVAEKAALEQAAAKAAAEKAALEQAAAKAAAEKAALEQAAAKTVLEKKLAEEAIAKAALEKEAADAATKKAFLDGLKAAG